MRPRVRSTLPVVEPVLLTALPDAFNDPAWLFEPKYDGYRGLLYVTRRGCRFRSKRGNVLERFQELCYSVREELPVKEAILDGEVVASDGQGRQNLEALLIGRGNLHYAAFDASGSMGKICEPAAQAAEAGVDRTGARHDHASLAGVLDRGAWQRSLRRGRAARSGGHRREAPGRSLRRDTVWYKIKSRTYTQGEGRWERFQKG